MGMFDNVRCLYPLPRRELQEELFQTKDTPNQWLDLYEIREDGTLWVEEYDIEDRSDPTAEGRQRLLGMLSRVNERWVPAPLTGKVVFYTDAAAGGWVEFCATFVSGRLTSLVELASRDGEGE